MRLGRLLVIAIAFALVGTACETITEVGDKQKPLQSSLSVTGAGYPTLNGVPTPSPGTSPTPTPTPTPGPTPTPTPTPTSNPVAKVTIKVYFVVCNNEGVPDSEGMTTVRVGCKVHLDMNAKDADNKPVETVGDPVWNYDRLDLIEVHEDTFTPYLFVKAPGELRVQGEVDGVTSNELLFHFYQ